ncbi:chalcone isomerase family protein [Sulfurospirillum sp. 1307]|jgi:hypothetical protein
MNIFKKFLILSLLLFVSSNLLARDIGEVNLPDSIEKPALVLNGAGIRSKFIFDLYVAGLYLQKKNNDAKDIINANKPMAIKLHIISSLISSEKMKDATMEGFENSTNNNIAPIKEKIEAFIDVFKEEIKKDDIYTFIYEPSNGVEIFKNSQLKSTIKGLDFKKALFGIWLSDKPAQESLKKNLLNI